MSPLGRHYLTGSGTFGIAVNDDGSMVASADGGPNGFSITLLKRKGSEWTTERLRARNRSETEKAGSDDEDDWKSVFLGVAFGRSDQLYASEGNSGRVRVFNVRTGDRTTVLDLNAGGSRDSYSGDLVVDRKRNLLHVLDQANFRVVTFDTDTRAIVASTRVGRLPFALAMSPDGMRLYVTNAGMFEYKLVPGANAKNARQTGLPFPAFGFPSKESAQGTKRENGAGIAVDVPALGEPNAPESNSLAVIDVNDATKPSLLALVPTGIAFGRRSFGGSSPSGVAATESFVYVSNGHNDSITVINAGTLRRERDIALRIPGLESVRGVLPIGLTVDPKTGWLLVAEAGINAIAVVEPQTGAVLGHIPSAWFPARVAIHGSDVFVANAKGFGTGPNKGLERSFQADLRRGAITMFPLPAASELKQHTDRVLTNNGFKSLGTPASSLPRQLQYAVIIVKENRTFDEVFGSGGRYGPAVAPNHHEIARRWSTGSNFYADSEVSVDGHHWLVGSYPNAWTESSLMAAYGGQKDFRLPSPAPGRLLFTGSNSSVHPEEQLENGTLWHHLDKHGIRFRNFGEGFELAGADEGEGLKPTGARFLTNVPMPDPLYRNTSRTYPNYNTNIPDQFRATQFITEMKGIRKMPRLLFIHLPNDHGAKPRPKDGYPVEASFMADNDYALGRIMEYLSRRPEWKQTAVFITEDDAQGGVDPVDSHRTVLMVAGPFAKPGYVSQRHSSFPGLLKTVFRILKLPPLNLYDAAASDLSDCFTDQGDFRPFDLKPVDPAIFDPKKAREPLDPEPSPPMDDPKTLREQHR